MKLKQLVFALISAGLFLAFRVPGAVAADITVTCSATDCSSIDEPLFQVSDWLPGDLVQQKTTIINQSGGVCHLQLETENEIDDQDLASVIFVAISDSQGSNLFGGVSGDHPTTEATLKDLFDTGVVYLTDIAAGATEVFTWRALFDLNAGNQYQLAETRFDFNLSFTCGSEPTPTNTPTPTSPPPAPAGGGGGTGGAAPAAAPAGGGGAGAGGGIGGLAGAVAGALAGLVPGAGPGAGGAGVLGQATQPGQIAGGVATEAGGVAGVAIGQRVCFWWLVFSLLALVINSLYLYQRRKELKSKRRYWLGPLGFSILSYWADRWMHHWWLPSRFCPWMILWSVLSFLIPFGLWWWRWRKVE